MKEIKMPLNLDYAIEERGGKALEQNKIIFIESFDRDRESSGKELYNIMKEDGVPLGDVQGFREIRDAISRAKEIMKRYCLDENQGEKGIERCENRRKITPSMGPSTIWRKLHFVLKKENPNG